MKKSIAAGALACCTLLAACGGTGTAPAPAPTVSMTETASSPEATTSSTGTTTSSPESTTSSASPTATSSRERDPGDSRGSRGDDELNSDDFPDSVTWADETPDGTAEHPGGLTTAVTDSEARAAGLKKFGVKVSDSGTAGLLTYPTSDDGQLHAYVMVNGLGDRSQLACSVRVFDADYERVPDSELTGDYRKLSCSSGGFLAPEASVGFTEPGEYTVVVGARSTGRPPAYIAVPVNVVE